MRAKILLPVIERLIVRNYSLYPGSNNDGLDLAFADGVTVLAGINGVGKTTLLTLLLRMLVGPSDPSKSERDIGRVSKRLLVPPRKFDFFQKRVPETLGDNAIATLHFRLGETSFVITRALANMARKTILVNGRRSNVESELELVELLAKKAGLGSAYDFHILVRYLQFFTEERLPILWSPGTQFEFFKILFLERDLATRLNDTFSLIQRKDSDYRNRRNQLTKRQEALPKAAENVKDTASVEIATLKDQASKAELAYNEADTLYTQGAAILERARAQSRALDAKLSEIEAQLALDEQAFAHADARYIAQALPGLEDKLQFLMQGLGSGRGCFVCGTRGRQEAAAISKKLRSGHCFVCNASVAKPESGNVTPLAVAEVRALERQIASGKAQITQSEEQRTANEANFQEAAQQLRQHATARTVALQAWETLKAQVPGMTAGPRSELVAEIEREEASLQALSAERDALTEDYRQGVDLAQAKMDALKIELSNVFTRYAEAFLQEDVRVNFKRNTPFKLATGAKKVNIPTFTISMTSSTHYVVEERVTSDSVSESQKEFLDLAFRMALLDLINTDRSAMMVIETPEASLDTWFMRRAADLMREFAPENSGQHRKLIATSNLNGTRMIPALLGLIDKSGKLSKLSSNQSSRLVDLMRLTATASVLKQNDARKMLEAEMGGYVGG